MLEFDWGAQRATTDGSGKEKPKLGLYLFFP